MGEILEVERAMGIEPTWPVWKTGTLPLSYARELWLDYIERTCLVNSRPCRLRAA